MEWKALVPFISISGPRAIPNIMMDRKVSPRRKQGPLVLLGQAHGPTVIVRSMGGLEIIIGRGLEILPLFNNTWPVGIIHVLWEMRGTIGVES